MGDERFFGAVATHFPKSRDQSRLKRLYFSGLSVFKGATGDFGRVRLAKSATLEETPILFPVSMLMLLVRVLISV